MSMEHFDAISNKLACLLGECGFQEAAKFCQTPKPDIAAMLARINKRVP
jgi:hypothetical protein